MLGVIVEILFIPFSGILSDRYGRRSILLLSAIGIGAFGLALRPLFESGMSGVYIFYIVILAFRGLNYGSIGGALAALFPAPVRYTGTSMAFNIAGILGASLLPYIATGLAMSHGARRCRSLSIWSRFDRISCDLRVERPRTVRLNAVSEIWYLQPNCDCTIVYLIPLTLVGRSAAAHPSAGDDHFGGLRVRHSP